MKNKIIISILLLIFLSTITFSEKIVIKKFNLERIIIENNFILMSSELKELLVPIYGKNLLLLSNYEIQKMARTICLIGLIVSFFPGVSFLGHISGFIAGCFLFLI